MLEETLTIAELAKLLKIDAVTLRKMASSGKFPAFKIGSDWRFTQDDVQEYIRQNRVAVKQEAKLLSV